MSKELFLCALIVGAALLAVWTHSRFPGLAPEKTWKTGLHFVFAFMLVMLNPGLGESQLAAFAGVFLLVLPALVYALLCTMWVLRIAQTALGVSR